MTKKEFRSLYDQNYEGIRRYIYFRSMNEDLANDVAQNVFLKIWSKKLNIAEYSIRPLLYKIANDEFISELRKRKHIVSIKNGMDKLEFEDKNQNEDQEERKLQLKKALALLTEKQRTVILMNKLEGLTYLEISESLNLSIKAVEKRMTSGMKSLREKIKEIK
ncbi:MAG: RNA polymerase subunit sigma-70 [Flavobacteriaceae bacterium]|nr:RNA polymerase subunit sigma-70 [Flavobacteriaceae bacterium]